MKKEALFSYIAALVLLTAACGQENKGEKDYPALHGQITYFQEKHELYQTFPVEAGDVVFMGDDVADRGIWDAFYGAGNIKNRGIALEGTECTLYRIEDIAKCRPAKLVISTGLYDLKRGCPVKDVKERIVEILTVAKQASPSSEVYYLAIVPDLGSKKVEGSVKDSAQAVNGYIETQFPDSFIAIDDLLCDESGYISPEYCVGDNRINGAGYEVISKAVAPYIGMKALNTIVIDPIMANADKSKSPETFYAEAYRERYKGRSAHYIARLSIFRSIPNTVQKTVMLGNSITNNCWWNELLEKDASDVINRGISGDTILGILDRLDEVADENPAKLYLLAGVNDMLEEPDITKEEVWSRYQRLLDAISEKMPDAELTISSTLPLNPMTKLYPGVNEKVNYLNECLKEGASRYGYRFVEVASLLTDENGDLSKEHTCDGIHLLPSAYHIWKGLL